MGRQTKAASKKDTLCISETLQPIKKQHQALFLLLRPERNCRKKEPFVAWGRKRGAFQRGSFGRQKKGGARFSSS